MAWWEVGGWAACVGVAEQALQNEPSHLSHVASDCEAFVFQQEHLGHAAVELRPPWWSLAPFLQRSAPAFPQGQAALPSPAPPLQDCLKELYLWPSSQ